MKEQTIDAFDERGELLFVGRVDHEDAAGLAGRKPPIVQVIAVHRHERASKIVRKVIVTEVGRAAQLVLLEHEEDVPAQAQAHVGDEPGGHVRIGVDSGTGGQTFGMRRER